MPAMKNRRFFEHKQAMLLLIVLLTLGCSRDKGEEEVSAYDPGKEPVRIGVCVSEKGTSKEYAEKFLDGIRVASGIMGVVNDARIELGMSDSCDTTNPDTIIEKMVQDGLQGLICIDEGVTRNISAFDAEQGGIVVIAGAGRSNTDTTARVFRLGSSLAEQARAAALFAVRSLKTPRVAVVLDQESSSCILLASMFSSELINAGGRIESITYIEDGSDEIDSSVISMMQNSPDAIYIPFSEETTLAAISLAKKEGVSADMIVSNVMLEQRFLDKGGRDLDGVYLIADFHPGAVQSQRGAALIDEYKENRKELGTLETCSALGSEAYFFLCDLLSNPDIRNDTLISMGKTLTGITGVSGSGRITKSMHACRIRSGFIRGTRTVYKESINPL